MCFVLFYLGDELTPGVVAESKKAVSLGSAGLLLSHQLCLWRFPLVCFCFVCRPLDLKPVRVGLLRVPSADHCQFLNCLFPVCVERRGEQTRVFRNFYSNWTESFYVRYSLLFPLSGHLRFRHLVQFHSFISKN